MNKVSIFLVLPIILSIGTIQYSSATQFVATKKGECINPKGYGIIRMRGFECGKIGGRFNNINVHPDLNQWIDCHLDWCEVPFSGKVAKSIVYTVCKPDEQILETLFSSSVDIFRPLGAIKLRAEDCGLMNGVIDPRYR